MTRPSERDDLAEALDALQEQFPGWRLWPTRDRRMVAGTRIDPSAGPSATLVEDTVEKLTVALEREKAAAIRLGL